MLDVKNLRKILSYDKDTGKFMWIERRGGKATAGSEAGTVNAKGYVHICIEGKKHLAHRLAWYFVYGEIPDFNLDHKDRCKTNNRIDNLRAATPSENAQNTNTRKNNKTGFKGVSFSNRDKKWISSISINGNQKYLGAFASPEDARDAYCAAAKKFHTHNPLSE